MNFWREHLGQLLAGGGAGFGATFLIVFREMIRDTWNDYRTKKRDEARAALARTPMVSVNGVNSDRLGAEITHQLMAMMTQELADRKSAEEKNWAILKDLLETVKILTGNVSSLQTQASAQSTLMQVIASRTR